MTEEYKFHSMNDPESVMIAEAISDAINDTVRKFISPDTIHVSYTSLKGMDAESEATIFQIEVAAVTAHENTQPN